MDFQSGVGKVVPAARYQQRDRTGGDLDVIVEMAAVVDEKQRSGGWEGLQWPNTTSSSCSRGVPDT